jgi:hypothetical protein
MASKIGAKFDSGDMVFYNRSDGSEILRVKDGTDGVEICASFIKGQKFSANSGILEAADICDTAKYFFIAPAPCQVISAQEVHAVPGATAGELDVVKVSGVLAPASGTSVLASAFNISNNATADTVQTVNGTSSTGISQLAAGDRLAVKGPVCTALAGASVEVCLKWI